MISLQNNWDTTSALIDQFLSFKPMENFNILGFVLSLVYGSKRQYSLLDNRRSNRKVFKSIVIYTCSPNIMHGFLRW